ncbi:MAG: hypothetical protein CEO21_184 [Microgenomates group bacterium Gr01-1014_80]|nr:MAG: hypothetical protein CEO21_184 [Microgenomates group bacterium Gr01-1014_80]
MTKTSNYIIFKVMKDFQHFAGLLSILAGFSAFAYAVSFIIISRSNPEHGMLLSGMFLMFTGIFTTAPWVAIYERLKAEDSGFVLWVMLLGIVTSLGMVVHGGYDLANSINPPAQNFSALANLPSQIDPRGLLTFGIGGLSLLVLSWVMDRTKKFPRNLAYLGILSAILSLTLYYGRLIILSPSNPVILYPALLNGFIISPLFYLWLGMVLKKK